MTAAREAGFTTICARDAGFLPSVSGTGNHYADSNRCPSAKCDLTRRALSCVSYQLSKLHMVIWLMIVEMKFSSSEQTSGQKAHYFNQMPRKCTWCNSITVNENFPSLLKKNAWSQVTLRHS